MTISKMMMELQRPLAVLPAYLSDLVSQLRSVDEGTERESKVPLPYGVLASDGTRVEIEAISGSGASRGNALAVVPLFGPLTPAGSYRGSSLDDFRRVVLGLDRNSNVSTIVLDITSPGGTVTGTPEAADAVRNIRARGETKVVAVANGMMASAATWIGTAAEEVVITPSGQAGSIGVISAYTDMSAAIEEMGIKLHIVRNPDKKARFSGVEPLTDEMREHMEQRNQAAYAQFLRAMADNRKNVRVNQVESNFGGGEMLDAAEAKEAGLVDRIATLDDTIDRLVHGSRRKAPGSVRAELDLAEAME